MVGGARDMYNLQFCNNIHSILDISGSTLSFQIWHVLVLYNMDWGNDIFCGFFCIGDQRDFIRIHGWSLEKWLVLESIYWGRKFKGLKGKEYWWILIDKGIIEITKLKPTIGLTNLSKIHIS